MFSFLIGCNSKPKFTDQEKVQARMFVEAINLDIEATQISNSYGPFDTIKDSDIEHMLELRKRSLAIATKIPNSVLQKMHEDLPEEYANYKKGLALRILNLQYGNVSAEIAGSTKVDKWGNWYTENKENIIVPKLKKYKSSNPR